MTHRERRRERVPFLLLAYEDVAWLKHALATLEWVIAVQAPSLPKLPLVREAVSHLHKKLSRTGERHASSYKVPITAHEMMILHTAVWLFVLAVEQQPDSADKQEALSHCLALRSRFVPFMGGIA